MPTTPTLRQQLNRLIASSVPPLRALVKERDHLRHQSLFWRYTHTRLYWQNRALCRELYGPAQPTATPPREIPPELFDRYTLGGTIPVENNYIDATYPANWPLIYTDEEIDAYLATISQNLKSPPDQRDWFIYGTLDEWVCEALAKYPIQGKTVVNMGSLTPWYESICIHFGARPVTIDYNPITMRTDRIRFLSIADWEREPERFEIGL